MLGTHFVLSFFDSVTLKLNNGSALHTNHMVVMAFQSGLFKKITFPVTCGFLNHSGFARTYI